MDDLKASESAMASRLGDWSQRGAMRFGLTVGVITVTAMLVCLYASAFVTLIS